MTTSPWTSAKGMSTSPDQINSGEPVEFPLRKEVFITAQIPPLDMGRHEIQHRSPDLSLWPHSIHRR